MDKLTGNFLTQPNMDFPLDCETLDMLQTAVHMVSAIGNIAGDKVILQGCGRSSEGSNRLPGYVFIRTKDFPEGEVLSFSGGAEGDGVFIKEEFVSVTARGYEYAKAYTRRVLAPGQGTEHWNWDEFTEVLNFKDMKGYLDNLKKYLETEVAKFREDPLGVVKIWAGGAPPDGFMVCDGRQLPISGYPELFKAIGSQFNECVGPNGTKYKTDDGHFRLPDLRSRFIVGINDEDEDYNDKGKSGGSKQHILTTDELPSHVHEMKDYYYAEGYEKGNYDLISTNGQIGSKSTDYDNDRLYYYKHNTNGAGNSHPHENRPPYYVLAYIIRVM